MFKTRFLKIKGDWKEVLDDCRATVGKGESKDGPSSSFKTRLLIAEHSPIRDIIVKWIWDPIMSFVATHWSRHKWECYIRTQRSDRTGVKRDKLPQDAPVSFTGEANSQNLIDSWRKRLCFQADPVTREHAEDFKAGLHTIEPELSDVLVPNCVYRCGCPEMKRCGFWELFRSWCETERGMDVRHLGIRRRYDLYNEYFYEVMWKEKET